MTTLQEKRHRETINSIARTTAQRDACLANLMRYEARLKDLRKLEARQAKILTKPPVIKTEPKPEPKPAPLELSPGLLKGLTDAIGHPPVNEPDLTIPAHLDRSTDAWKARDAADRKKAEEEIAERKRTKAAAQAATRKAKASGETRKMPLTGKAALAHIKSAG